MTVIDTPTESEQPDSAPDPESSTPLGSLVVIAMIAIIVVTVAVIGAVAVAALVTSDSDDGGGGGGAAASSTQIEVALSEFVIEGNFTVPAGQVSLNVTNEGTMEHNVILRDTGARTANLAVGASELLDLGTLTPGTYELYCDIAGHEDAGMVVDLVVTESAGGGGGGGEGAPEAEPEEELDSAAMDQRMIDSMLAFPAATEGLGNQPLEFELLPDGTKKFELTAAVVPWERSPGDVVDAWAYNGQVPGPQIRVDLGDKVQVVVNNETPLGTDVHWHGIHTPNDQDGVSPYTQDPISTGTTFTYEFVADDPAIGMYHAHLHSQISVPNGMFGVFIIGDNPYPLGETISGVEIPADLEVALDMPMVLNDAGVIGLSLNGKSFPGTEPVVLEQGQWATVHYYNEGLTDHPMHLHQMPQLVYAKDGIPLDHPYWADTINVAPGERYSVLFKAEDIGTWVWHCHILTHVEREEGMFGMVTAVVVTEPT
ncbi:multicopper oxidase domain-containing protein [Ilumatobacter sp.]|uniref:multicopper oxidase domain-containing protein n=1 Tax=Ilumatobacter sp. TaxID=1967498 RepID=UPI003AF90C10